MSYARRLVGAREKTSGVQRVHVGRTDLLDLLVSAVLRYTFCILNGISILFSSVFFLQKKKTRRPTERERAKTDRKCN